MLTPFLASLWEEADAIVPRLFAGCRLTRVAQGYVGRCPFHRNAPSPTLFVSTEAPLWRCFAGHEGGDWFAFLAHREGLNIPEAAQALARIVAAPTPDTSRFDQAAWRRADRRAHFLWTVEHLCMGRLWTKHGRDVVTALVASGLTEDAIVARRIGMALTGDDIRGWLRKKGVYDPALLESAGLADGVVGGRFGEVVAQRDRLGRVNGFGGAPIR